eukprot:jgi/Astpho2/754/fgenesh1_pg.00016_%23_8_t
MGLVKIHVFDEARGAKQNFTCEYHLLLGSMRYFRLYLKKVAPTQDLEISVQCDVAVFSWLLQYTKAAAARRQPPVLTISNCMPVLIASHFLQMEELVVAAVQFVAQQFQLVAQVSSDLSGLAEELLSRLAQASEVPEEALEACWRSSHAAAAHPNGSSSAPNDGQAAAAVLKDQPDQNGKAPGRPSTSLLVLRLYRHKLGHLLGDSSTTLCRCSQCGTLFSAVHRHKLVCRQTREGSDQSTGSGSGFIVRRHMPDRHWKLPRYIEDLQQRGMYPCCGQRVQRSSLQQQQGCCHQQHEPLLDDSPVASARVSATLASEQQRVATLARRVQQHRHLLGLVLPGHIDLLKGLRHVPPSTGNQQPLLGQQAAGSGTSSMACVSGLCKDNPKLQQALRQDLMREDDCRAMDVLIARLDAMRNPAGPAQQQPRAAVPPGAARPPSASSSVKSSWAARPGRPRSSSVPRRRMTK